MKKFILSTLILCSLLGTFIPGVLAHDLTKATAVSIGTNYGLFDINTSNDAQLSATTFGTLGMNSYYNIQPTYQYMRGNNPYTNQPRMESKILFFSGHANYDNMAWNYNGNNGDYKTGVYIGYNFDSPSTGYKYAGIQSYNMSKVKLVVFGGCKTAFGSYNIAKKANDLGARVSLGWSDSIGASSHSNWFDKFLYKLSGSYSVNAAVNYANSFSYSDNGVKNVVVYGDGLYTPGWDNTSNVSGSLGISNKYGTRPEQLVYQVNYKLGDSYNIESLNKIVESFIIENIDENFDIKNYIYDKTESLNKVYYDFKLVVNGAISDSAYTVVVDNNTIESIVDNTKDIDINDNSVKYYKVNKDLQNKLATKIRNDILSENDNYGIVSQTVYDIYVSNEKSYKTYIRTEIYDNFTNTYFVRENFELIR